MTQTVIIGGGPAGMAAAIAAARRGEDTLLVERLDRVGKKLLATGNGRCNLMNRSAPALSGRRNLCPSGAGPVWRKRIRVLLPLPGTAPAHRGHGTGVSRQRTSRLRARCPAHGPDAGRCRPCVPLALCNVWKNVVSASPFLCLTMFCAPHVLLWQEAERHSRSWAATAPAMRSLPDWGTPCGAPFPALTQIETETAPLRGFVGHPCKGGSLDYAKRPRAAPHPGRGIVC